MFIALRTTLKTKALTISSLSVILMLCCLGLTAPLLLLSVDYFSLKTLLQQNNLKDSFRIFNPQSKIFSYIRTDLEAMQPHDLIEFTFLPLYNTN